MVIISGTLYAEKLRIWSANKADKINNQCVIDIKRLFEF